MLAINNIHVSTSLLCFVPFSDNVICLWVSPFHIQRTYIPLRFSIEAYIHVDKETKVKVHFLI